MSEATFYGVDYVRRFIRDVPDFPRPGIVFKDITPILSNSRAFGAVIDMFEEHCRAKNPTHILGIEARGFIIGAPLAERMGLAFVPVRKPGKLPWETVSQSYELEYGVDTIEMHRDAVRPEDRVAIVDDLLATGGTAKAACQLVERVGARVVTVAGLVDLAFLPWREKLAGYDTMGFIRYDAE